MPAFAGMAGNNRIRNCVAPCRGWSSRGFPLHPETPQEGRSLEELFAERGVDLAASMERLKRVALECGLP
jgi:hypothetical protein